MMKYVLKKSLAKAGIYSTILTFLVVSYGNYRAYVNCLKFPSLTFSVVGAISMYFVVEGILFASIGIFQIAKNILSYVTQPPVPESEENTEE